MEYDAIVEIGIDEQQRLYVTPKTQKFQLIYREAMEVHWDQKGYLYAPAPPRSNLKPLLWWFNQILSAVREQGYELHITAETTWHQIPEALRQEISSSGGVNA